jgi:hypothetical protein
MSLLRKNRISPNWEDAFRKQLPALSRLGVTAANTPWEALERLAVEIERRAPAWVEHPKKEA